MLEFDAIFLVNLDKNSIVCSKKFLYINEYNYIQDVSVYVFLLTNNFRLYI